LTTPEEDIKKWVNFYIEERDLNAQAKKFALLKPFDEKQYYARLSEKQLDEVIDRDLNTVLMQNLFELKTFIIYDLRLNKSESDAVFWNFVGNPLYRMLERTIVEHCRKSEEYHIELLQRIDAKMVELRRQRELPKEGREKPKNGTK
jgi:hypothetical protein